jgi:hypothetical protein
MRSWVALSVVALPLAAVAAPKKKPESVRPPPENRLATDKPKPIDITPVIDKLDVFKDDLDHFYVSPRPGTVAFEDAGAWVFFGNAKAMYRQRVIGSSVEGGKHYEWNLWSPRAKGMNAASLDFSDDAMALSCTQKSKRPLSKLKADEARTFLQHATFYQPLWTHQAHLLARDDDATYYYVDELREEFGGNGYRVFVGPKGAMKELPLANIATDTAGEIFATKSGQLKLISGEGKKAYWIKGGKKMELTVVDTYDNRYLIYRELGIYGQLGAVCDDQ